MSRAYITIYSNYLNQYYEKDFVVNFIFWIYGLPESTIYKWAYGNSSGKR